MVLQYEIEPTSFSIEGNGQRQVKSVYESDLVAEELIAGELPGRKYAKIQLYAEPGGKLIKGYDLHQLRIMKKNLDKKAEIKKRMRRGL